MSRRILISMVSLSAVCTLAMSLPAVEESAVVQALAGEKLAHVEDGPNTPENPALQPVALFNADIPTGITISG